MSPRYDVVVVGAGPSGSTAACICAKSGLSTLLIEEQAHIGYPVQCAGLLSTGAFEECQVSQDCVLNDVSGAVVSAGSFACSFDAGRRMAYVVDRGQLDREMAFKAADAGCEISLKTIATRVSPKEHEITVHGLKGSRDIRYSVLIAADGPRSMVARGLGIPRAPAYLSGLQCDVMYESDQDHVRIFPNASPEFFGWIIPIGPGRARIGMCGITRMYEKFQAFIHPFQDQCTQFVSGTIPLGTLSRTYDDGILITGDAAALAKPTSGGGVYTGVRSARHAAATAIAAMDEDNPGKPFFSRYEMAWKQDFGKEIQRGFSLFRFRQQITPSDMERLIAVLSDKQIRSVIASKGDMDRPWSLVLSLLFHPRMIPAYPLIGKALLKLLRSK
ncbi:MAG: NAD(P)/FAD-dependent oxidoreductase [Methanospirillum sp.]|nr:NAD(P)/FAD-dependent oxidoreductase [Methanospirillum sp.]